MQQSSILSPGMFLPAGLVLLVGVVGCNHVSAVLTLTLCVGMGGFAAAGFGVNHLDISPKYCGEFLTSVIVFTGQFLDISPKYCGEFLTFLIVFTG